MAPGVEWKQNSTCTRIGLKPRLRLSRRDGPPRTSSQRRVRDGEADETLQDSDEDEFDVFTTQHQPIAAPARRTNAQSTQQEHFASNADPFANPTNGNYNYSAGDDDYAERGYAQGGTLAGEGRNEDYDNYL